MLVFQHIFEDQSFYFCYDIEALIGEVKASKMWYCKIMFTEALSVDVAIIVAHPLPSNIYIFLRRTTWFSCPGGGVWRDGPIIASWLKKTWSCKMLVYKFPLNSKLNDDNHDFIHLSWAQLVRLLIHHYSICWSFMFNPFLTVPLTMSLKLWFLLWSAIWNNVCSRFDSGHGRERLIRFLVSLQNNYVDGVRIVLGRAQVSFIIWRTWLLKLDLYPPKL